MRTILQYKDGRKVGNIGKRVQKKLSFYIDVWVLPRQYSYFGKKFWEHWNNPTMKYDKNDHLLKDFFSDF